MCVIHLSLCLIWSGIMISSSFVCGTATGIAMVVDTTLNHQLHCQEFLYCQEAFAEHCSINEYFLMYYLFLGVGDALIFHKENFRDSTIFWYWYAGCIATRHCPFCICKGVQCASWFPQHSVITLFLHPSKLWFSATKLCSEQTNITSTFNV